MAMKWNSKDYQFDPNGGNGGESFEVHDKRMREFHSSHADVAMVNGPRLDEAALLERMASLQVSRTMMETGGSQLLKGTTDWSALVPMWKVAGYKLARN